MESLPNLAKEKSIFRPNKKYKAAYSGFIPPSNEKRAKALGNMTNECQATKLALRNVYKYWEPLRQPHGGDWLSDYNHGCGGYDTFGGKIITPTRSTIYI